MSAGTAIKPWRERIGPDGIYRHMAKLPGGVEYSDCCDFGSPEIEIFAADQEIAELRAALEAAEHQRSMLAQAIADASRKAGIWNGEVSLTGPHLIMFCDDMASAIKVQPDSGRDAALKEKRIKEIQSAAATKAFREFTAMFISKRAHIANLMAHHWQITAIEMRSQYGVEDIANGITDGTPERIVTTPEQAKLAVANFKSKRAAAMAAQQGEKGGDHG